MSRSSGGAARLRDLALLRRSGTGSAAVVQEPADQPYEIRDCAVRDPAGNMIRIQEAQ